MQGIFVAGTGPEAGEREVAAAICAAAEAAGSTLASFVAGAFDTVAAPAVAARHAGAELQPPVLVADARAAGEDADLLVAATSGGLLAPLAERYLNRDLAVELRLPIVIAAPAAPGLVNGALLTLEAARGAGLAVAAVVISGWPDQPSRLLLDERALLERMASVQVESLGAAARPSEAISDASAGWPVSDWLAAAPGGASGGDGSAAPVRISLDPYSAWEEHPVGDPRGTSRTEIMNVILEIAGAEGPMRASRAYALYNRASGGRKLTSVARAPLSSAVYWLAQEHRLALTRKDDIPWQDDDLIRLPDAPPVKVRELGPRTLEEVPLDEIAELVGRLRAARGIDDPMELKRAILSTYGLMRLTSRADQYLGLALDLAGVT
jgi:dethiobiotin synthetase